MQTLDRLQEDKITRLIWKLMPEWQQEYFVAIREQMALTERNSKYQKITTALLFASTFNPIARIFLVRPTGIAPAIWMAYHFCRKIDDIADGDAMLPPQYNSFSDMTKKLKSAMDNNTYLNTAVEICLRGTVRDMKTYHGVDIREDIYQFLNTMNYERERRINKTISTRAELFDLYQSSFGVPQDISLICMGSTVRSKNIPELADLQGRLYAVRDLVDELAKGIVFIPKEILSNGITVDELCNSYQSNPNIIAWVQEELKEGKELIYRLKQKKMDLGGKMIVNYLIKGIDDYIAKFQK